MGRPTKLNPEIQAKIVNLIKAGNYNEVACQAVGIHKDTFYFWMEKGRAAKSGIYSDFSDAIENASAVSEAHYLELIHKAAKEDTTKWQASAWFLERKFKKRWMRAENTIHSGDKDNPIQVDMDALLEKFKRMAENK